MTNQFIDDASIVTFGLVEHVYCTPVYLYLNVLEYTAKVGEASYQRPLKMASC